MFVKKQANKNSYKLTADACMKTPTLPGTPEEHEEKKQTNQKQAIPDASSLFFLSISTPSFPFQSIRASHSRTQKMKLKKTGGIKAKIRHTTYLHKADFDARDSAPGTHAPGLIFEFGSLRALQALHTHSFSSTFILITRGHATASSIPKDFFCILS